MGIHSDDQKAKMKEMQDNLQADTHPLKRYRHIGERGGRRLDGYKKAGGDADYTMDVQLPGMLFMRFLDAPYPHAKIVRMDTRRAEIPRGCGALRRRGTRTPARGPRSAAAVAPP